MRAGLWSTMAMVLGAALLTAPPGPAGAATGLSSIEFVDAVDGVVRAADVTAGLLTALAWYPRSSGPVIEGSAAYGGSRFTTLSEGPTLSIHISGDYSFTVQVDNGDSWAAPDVGGTFHVRVTRDGTFEVLTREPPEAAANADPGTSAPSST